MFGRPTSSSFKPSLESLDGRIVPRAGGVTPFAGFDVARLGSTSTAAQTATRFAVQVQRSAFAGAAAEVTVVAVDGSGRPVRDYTGTVTLSSSDAGATLPAAYTFTSADRGRHTFSVTLASVGSQTLTATDAAATPLTGTGRVSVTAAPVATQLFVRTERDVFTGAATRVLVVALDASNRPVPTYTGTVTLTSTDAGATLPAAYTFTANDRGVKVFTLTPSASGTQTVTATDGAGLTGRVTVSVQDAPVAAELVVRVIAGRDGVTRVLVAAVDATGKPVSTYTGTVTLTSSDAAATLPAAYTFTAADRGVKVFELTLPTAGSTTVTAADADGLTAGQTVTVPVVGGQTGFPGGRRSRR